MRYLLIFSLILASNVVPASAESVAREIIVAGEGRVSVVPDMATLRIGVQRQSRTAGEAMSLASADMSAVLKKLLAVGIENRDLQTSNVGLSPRYQHFNDGRPPRITGYIASNNLVVRVRDLNLLGKVLDQVVDDGANTLNGIFFGVADKAPSRERARELAVTDARTKAGQLARAAGVELGKVMTIRESGVGQTPVPIQRGMMLEAADSTPIAAGEIDILEQVTVIFGISEN